MSISLRTVTRFRFLALLTSVICLNLVAAKESSAKDKSVIPSKPAVAFKPNVFIAAETTRRMRTAVERGLQVVQKAAGNYPKHRQCFSCHHQTLPLLAMEKAKGAGFKIDEKLFKEQVTFTRKSFRSRIEDLKAGKGIGGRAMTVAYGLWTLAIADEKPDELSAAMVTYLLKTQRKDGSWRPPSHRPPLEESAITCTALALYPMISLSEKSQEEAITAASKKSAEWLFKVKPKTTEDHVFILFVLFQSQDEEQQKDSLDALLKLQRPDGGWAQQPGMSSDAYATGQVLFTLLMKRRDPNGEAIKRAVAFLLKTQQPDGSWFVKTRSKPVQKFFDNGDPHGKSQFISIAATSWATAALARAVKKR